MYDSGVMLKRRPSEWLGVKTAPSSGSWKAYVPSPPSSHSTHTLPFKSRTTLWGRRTRPRQTVGRLQGEIYVGPIKPLKRQQLTRAVESNKNHIVYIIALPSPPSSRRRLSLVFTIRAVPYASVHRCCDGDVTCYDSTLPNCGTSQARATLTATGYRGPRLTDADRNNKHPDVTFARLNPTPVPVFITNYITKCQAEKGQR